MSAACLQQQPASSCGLLWWGLRRMLDGWTCCCRPERTPSAGSADTGPPSAQGTDQPAGDAPRHASKAAATWIVPTVQLGFAGVRQDEECTAQVGSPSEGVCGGALLSCC